MHFFTFSRKISGAKILTNLVIILRKSNKMDRTTIFCRKKLEKLIITHLDVDGKQRKFFCSVAFFYGRYCTRKSPKNSIIIPPQWGLPSDTKVTSSLPRTAELLSLEIAGCALKMYVVTHCFTYKYAIYCYNDTQI